MDTFESGTVLAEDGSNLALVLNDHQKDIKTWKRINDLVSKALPDFEGFSFDIRSGTSTVLLFIQERGLESRISIARLSDGTLRFLCLLAILLHPEPPPLICIEEPEIGLHPDIIVEVADLLIDASKRTQLIVATHSDLLVSAIGEKAPESIVVCEKRDNETTMERFDPKKHVKWLEDYSLGDIWMTGEIGGARW